MNREQKADEANPVAPETAVGWVARTAIGATTIVLLGVGLVRAIFAADVTTIVASALPEPLALVFLLALVVLIIVLAVFGAAAVLAFSLYVWEVGVGYVE